MKKNLNEYVDTIHSTIEEKIKTIIAIEYHYKLTSIINSSKGLSKKEVSIIMESLINKYLELLKPIYSVDKHKQVTREVDEITDFFSEGNDDAIISEGDLIADDLLAKVAGRNNRKITLPIKIEFIKDYCISSIITSKEVDKVLLWIILRLSTIYFCLTNENLSSN